jgi:hypothetical protein
MFDLEHLNSHALMKLIVSASVVFHVGILQFEISFDVDMVIPVR